MHLHFLGSAIIILYILIVPVCKSFDCHLEGSFICLVPANESAGVDKHAASDTTLLTQHFSTEPAPFF